MYVFRASIRVSWILISPNMIFRLPKSTAKQPEENGTKVLPFRWKGNRKENKNVCELEAKRFISCFRRERQKLGKKFLDLCFRQKSSVTNKKQDEKRPFSQRKILIRQFGAWTSSFLPKLHAGESRNWFRSFSNSVRLSFFTKISETFVLNLIYSTSHLIYGYLAESNWM